jgi:hypothetical protein
VFRKLTGANEVLLEDRANLRAFTLLIEADRSRLADARRVLTDNATPPDADGASIFQGLLCCWPRVKHDAAWQRNLAALINEGVPARVDRQWAQHNQGACGMVAA